MNKIKIGIVASEFNYDVTYSMVELAKEHANFLGAEVYSIIKVPGAFEIPLAVKMLLEKKDVSAVIALGAVIEGQTEHDEIVIQHASRKLSDLSLEYNKPVALGISGPGMSRIEAHERVDYAKRAVEAAVKMCRILSQEDNEIEIVSADTKKEKTEVRKTKKKLPYKTETEITKGITKKGGKGKEKPLDKNPE